MAIYLQAILPATGQLPLLKDSTWDTPFSAGEVLFACALFFADPSLKAGEESGLYPQLLFGVEAARRFRGPAVRRKSPTIDLPATGHYVIRDDQRGDYLIFDAGKPCPEYLPAHAHADLLTYELSIAGQRTIVDSGVYEYAQGDWRDFFRSTRAHNTVEVNGQNQSEVWGSFRVGRRARPGPVFWQATTEAVLVRSEHDGYRRLPVPLIHERTIFVRYGEFWVVIDQLWGHRQTTAASYIHLHPALSFNVSGIRHWQIRDARVPLSITAFGDLETCIVNGRMEHPRQGWYSENFGELRPNPVLALQFSGDLPSCFGYVISREAVADARVETIPNGHRVAISFQGRNHCLNLIRNEPPHLK